MERASFLIRELGLESHPEGGFFCEVFRSPHRVDVGGDQRSAFTVIYLLLGEGEHSRWHRITHEEAWHFHEGDPVELVWIDPHVPVLERRVLSPVGAPGQPVAVVPAGAWQAARCQGRYSLVACTVAPGFEYSDFELMAEDQDAASRVRASHPELASLI